MTKLEEIIASLSEEELDLLNSDPNLLAEFKAKYAAPKSIAEANLESLSGQGPLGDLKGAWKVGEEAAKKSAAGIYGLASLPLGLETAKQVAEGDIIFPGQKAAEGLLDLRYMAVGEAVEAATLGPKVAKILGTWSKEAAVSTIGKISNLAKRLGIETPEVLGDFLLEKVSAGGKTFEPIITAGKSPTEMARTVSEIKQAAGKQLEDVASQMDKAIESDVSLFDWAGLRQRLEALKEAEVGDIGELAPAVTNQYNSAINTIDQFITKQLKGTTEAAFSDLAAIKTKIGKLVFKHGEALPSKAALEDVYIAINEAEKLAATKVSPTLHADYTYANQLYHKASSIEEGLAGKVIDAQKWFASPTSVNTLAALTTGTGVITHNPLAALAIPASYVAGKIATKYGPQAITRALYQGSKLAAPLIQSTLPASPSALKGIQSALSE